MQNPHSYSLQAYVPKVPGAVEGRSSSPPSPVVAALSRRVQLAPPAAGRHLVPLGRPDLVPVACEAVGLNRLLRLDLAALVDEGIQIVRANPKISRAEVVEQLLHRLVVSRQTHPFIQRLALRLLTRKNEA